MQHVLQEQQYAAQVETVRRRKFCYEPVCRAYRPKRLAKPPAKPPSHNGCTHAALIPHCPQSRDAKGSGRTFSRNHISSRQAPSQQTGNVRVRVLRASDGGVSGIQDEPEEEDAGRPKRHKQVKKGTSFRDLLPKPKHDDSALGGGLGFGAAGGTVRSTRFLPGACESTFATYIKAS